MSLPQLEGELDCSSTVSLVRKHALPISSNRFMTKQVQQKKSPSFGSWPYDSHPGRTEYPIVQRFVFAQPGNAASHARDHSLI